jgi:hypothetical protein
VEKQAARATITPSTPTKPRAKRKPTAEKVAAVARSTQTRAQSKPATARRRLAKSA